MVGTPNITVEQKSKWTNSGGEGTDVFATHIVSDATSGLELHATERNAFDVGYQVFIFDNSVDSKDVDDWVNDMVATVSGVIETGENGPAHKYEVSITNMANYDRGEETVELVCWDDTVDEVSVGDEIYIDSVIVKEFDGSKYLEMNSNSVVEEVSINYMESLQDEIKQYLSENGAISQSMRM